MFMAFCRGINEPCTVVCACRKRGSVQNHRQRNTFISGKELKVLFSLHVDYSAQ
jgi:hypothetical protein